MPIKNEQQIVAEQFHLSDIQLIKANYEATLKIKRWKFIHSIPVLSARIKKEADIMIEESFLRFVNNYEVLMESGYYNEMMDN